MKPQSGDQTWTVGRVLAWAAQDFRQRGIPSPRLEAELLLGRVLGCDRVRLFIDSGRPLSPDELGQYRELIQRRRRSEPVAYILGEREFFGLPLRVDPRVLIPRPDTEVLVETALRRTSHIDLFGKALDVCTGSGCVALAFASRRPTWQVQASDLSEAAVEVARENALRLGLPLVVRRGDLFDGLTERFDLVTANPPYIAAEELPTLPPDVRDYEPHLALLGGTDGLDFYRRLADEAPAYLASNGVLAAEVGYGQAPAVARMLAAAGFRDVRIDRDYADIERVVSAVAPEHSAPPAR